MSLDERRIAELFVPADNSVGAGYLVSPHLVLTTKHVVAGAISPGAPPAPPPETLTATALAELAGDQPRCRVRLLSRERGLPFHDAVPVWWDSAADAALLGVFGPGWWPPSSLTGLTWSDLEGVDPVTVLAVGFPVADVEGALREAKEITGTILPVTGYKNGRWVINVKGRIGRAPAGSASPWAGMSGAAVFAGHSLIGLIRIDADPGDPTRMELWAEPLRGFAEDRGLAGWLTADAGPGAWTRAARNPELDEIFRLYITTRHHKESEVKFQQVDMDNRLLDLFIDVPIDRFSPRPGSERNPFYPEDSFLQGFMQSSDSGFGHTNFPPSWASPLLLERTPTAISLLLGSEVPATSKLLLRGGPGQGKSTITQYLCELHRMRLLGSPELAEVPPEHLHGVLRYPLRVDLKAMALWVMGKNPYSEAPYEALPVDAPKTVEGFLANHVFRNSGGRSFDVKQLQDFLGGRHVLLVFDGLDEVTDPAAREKCVDELTAAVDRLEPGCASLQVIVTSRPVNHGNAQVFPVFPQRGFAILDLGILTRELIESYAQRWTRATKLGEQRGHQIVRTLMARLGEPQVADLARYPMQLAILLTLMRRKPESLPDRRTPLYNGYVEIFFDREAVTDKLVAENISLIQKIHRHVAWLLQSGREKGQFLTGMPRDVLLSEVRTLAKARKVPTALAERLVESTERNYMLVNRTGKGFEFEVDPLREYFCAIHLFETADDSPASGKAARFKTMALSPAWFEVTRFYAGCAREGEQPALVLKLRELLSDDDPCLRLNSQLRILALTLLTDRVFTEVPLAAQDLAKNVMDDLGFRLVLSADRGLKLPEVARDVLVRRAKRMLSARLPPDAETDVMTALRSAFAIGVEPLPEADTGKGTPSANSAPLSKLYDWWYSQLFSLDIDEEYRTRWLERGCDLEFIANLSDHDVERLFSAQDCLTERVAAFFRARDYRLATLSPELAEAVRAVMMSGFRFPTGDRHPLSRAGDWLWALITQSGAYQAPATEPDHLPSGPSAPGTNDLFDRCNAFAQACDQLNGWADSSAPWLDCVETGRGLLGDGFVWLIIAAQAAGFGRNAANDVIHDLTDETIPLVRRALSAWRNANDEAWWARQAETTKSSSAEDFVLLLLLGWSSAGVMISLTDWVRERLNKLSDYEYRRLMSSIHFIRQQWAVKLPETTLDFTGARLPERWHPRSAAAYAIRASEDSRKLLYEAARLKAYRGEDVPVLTFCVNEEASDEMSADDLDRVLQRLKAIYKVRRITLTSFENAHFAATVGLDLPKPCGIRVAERARDYPWAVVNSADTALREALAPDLPAVSDVAQEAGWFEPARFGAERGKRLRRQF